MGRPKRTLKRSVKLEDPGSASEKKVRRIVADELPEFNPWAVEDVSIFLKYNCPECKFNDQTLKGSKNIFSYASKIFTDLNKI